MTCYGLVEPEKENLLLIEIYEHIGKEMIYGYIRVSTHNQDADNQKYELLNYAYDNKLGQLEIMSEVVSGKTSWKKREIAGLIDKLSKGDILLVTELSRLGRSMLEIFEIISIVLRAGASVRSVKGNYILEDNIHSKVLVFAMSLAAEIERELISQRTKESLKRKKAEGVQLGRPVGSKSSKLDKKAEEIKELCKKGVSIASIAKIYNVSYTAMYHFIKTRDMY